jgi:hypothetical protein
MPPRNTDSDTSPSSRSAKKTPAASNKKASQKRTPKSDESEVSADEDSDDRPVKERYDAQLKAIITGHEELISKMKQAMKPFRKSLRDKKKGNAAQYLVPPPLTSVLKNPEDDSKLTKTSTLSRMQLGSAIFKRLKEKGTEAKGGRIPDDKLREALGVKSKKAVLGLGDIQKCISALYKEHNITAIKAEEDDAASSKKKGKRASAKDDSASSDEESVESEVESEDDSKGKKKSKKTSRS